MKHVPPGHPAYQLVHGSPAGRITAAGETRICSIGVHGEEELAALVEHEIQEYRPDLTEHTDYRCGNPLAAAQGLRAQSPYDDLNRSFNLPEDHPRYHSPERKIADVLLPELLQYKYVLDPHTSDTECGRFFLVARPNHPAVRDIIACSTIDRVVVMPPHITAPSLIGNVAQAASIEYNEELAHEPKAAHEIIDIMDGLIAGKPMHGGPRERQFYYVDHAVPKTDDPGNVQNFKYCKEGYYPVLFGEGPKSYRNDPSKTYLGFAALRKKSILL